MSTELTPVEEFINSVAAVQAARSSATPAPSIVTLQGSEGKWYESKWNAETQEREKLPFQDKEDGTFAITPLVKKFYCKWKYAEGSTSQFRTREFYMNEPIELLKITFADGQKAVTESVETFPNYASFKERFVKVDELTKKAVSPYDFHIVVYGYSWTQERIVKVDLKGSSRGAWFDFDKGLEAKNNVKILSQLLVNMQTSHDKMPSKDKTKPDEIYYFADPRVERVHTMEEMETIMKATTELTTWMGSYNKTEVLPETAPVKELDTASIPL